MGFILNTGIVLAIFLGFLLLSKKGRLLTDNILAIWLFVIGIHLLNYWFHLKGYWDAHPHLIGLTVPFPFFYGPLLYLYVVYSQKDKQHLRKTDYLHFTPVLLSYLYLLPFYFTYSPEQKTALDKGLIDDYSVFSSVLLVLFIVSGLTYVIISYRKLQYRNRMLEENFSYSERINLKWLRFAIISFALAFGIAGIVSLVQEVFEYRFPFNADLLYYSIIVFFVVYVGYSGIKQQGLFASHITKEEELAPVAKEGEYKNSGLKAETAIAKHKELLALMESEKPYLNPKLTLNDLAQEMGLSSNHLSQIINQNEQVNFHDFVNKYRIEEFIERAKSKKSFSLLAHALDSGFNSKSSFNTVFKKFKKLTPSQFISNLDV